MDFQIGDIAVFNEGGCWDRERPALNCEVLSTVDHDGCVSLRILDDDHLIDHSGFSEYKKDTHIFLASTRWVTLASRVEAISIDVSDYL